MEDLSFSEMFKMQRELWEKHKNSWSPLEPAYARNSLLWMIGEIGEVIDIVKKCGETTIIEDKCVKSALTEELCDVLMYFNDVLLRYDISAKDIAEMYTYKHNKNLHREFKAENQQFINSLGQ